MSFHSIVLLMSMASSPSAEPPIATIETCEKMYVRETAGKALLIAWRFSS